MELIIFIIPLYTVVRMRNRANLLNALEHFKTSFILAYNLTL